MRIIQALIAVLLLCLLSTAQQSSGTASEPPTQTTSQAEEHKNEPLAQPSDNSNKGESRPAGSRKSFGEKITAPKAIYTPDPEYPKGVKRRKDEGKVVVWVFIDKEGNPSDLKIVRTGGTAFDEKAIEAVRKWRFKPATKDGQPVGVQVNIEIDFSKVIPAQWR